MFCVNGVDKTRWIKRRVDATEVPNATSVIALCSPSAVELSQGFL
jgi:hypothetical protein